MFVSYLIGISVVQRTQKGNPEDTSLWYCQDWIEICASIFICYTGCLPTARILIVDNSCWNYLLKLLCVALLDTYNTSTSTAGQNFSSSEAFSIMVVTRFISSFGHCIYLNLNWKSKNFDRGFGKSSVNFRKYLISHVHVFIPSLYYSLIDVFISQYFHQSFP